MAIFLGTGLQLVLRAHVPSTNASSSEKTWNVTIQVSVPVHEAWHHKMAVSIVASAGRVAVTLRGKLVRGILDFNTRADGCDNSGDCSRRKS